MSRSVYTNEYQAFIELLRLVREEAGLSQRQVAERLNRSQSYVAKSERGHNRVDVAQLVAICQALDLPLMEFMRRYDAILQEMEKPSNEA